jgi:outer membrane receptor protein involved in Fe transport
VASDVRGRGFFENVGDTLRQGIEAQAEWRSGPWRAFATYALTDATFQTALTLTSPDNPAADASGLIHVRPGDRIPGVVRQRLKLGLAYQAARWRLALDAASASGVYLTGDEANLQPMTGAYVVANLSGSWRLTRTVELFGTIENLADARYETAGTFAETSAVFLAEAPGATNPRSLTPGEPRTFELGVRVSY